jgi:hypothetical protein
VMVKQIARDVIVGVRPDVSVFTEGKVEIMFKLSYEQAENLARLMKGHDL